MKGVSLAGVIAVGLTVAACGEESEPAVPPQQPPSLTVGIKFDQPGMSVMGPDGVPRGFDADAATYIAGKLGVTPEHIVWKEARSEDRERLLNSGAVDFVVASYSITAGRQQQVSFAGPYLVAGQDLLVRQSERKIERPEDLNGRTVCTAEGSSSADKIRKDFAARADLVTRDTYVQCVADLLTGTVDAVSTDDVILAGYAAQHPGTLRVVGHRFTREHYGVGVRKGDIDMQARITRAIRMMIDDGTWRRAIEANISPSGHRTLPPPPVFNAPDKEIAPGDRTQLDPELVRITEAIAATFNAQDWEGFQQLVCPETAQDIDDLVIQYTPQYDRTLGPEVRSAGFTKTITGITQTSPNSATYLAHESFTNIPEKYRRYFKDIDYTGTMVRRDGEWRLCSIAADFVEP
ncbi:MULTISPECIES: glutamate ABC transporter substrate-binding protein [unclassified Nocardia]|uniref:glutamate ABC transporter substrate-binding protein n=1 Tax=unclassified Nocardia TaxID=2637762 RepID=UPI0024A9EEF1|nr:MULTISPECIES: glutamate ABC transporter substrate-binding protein [unclassified Nocardia]